jgi:AcrR family transcriptional regulator
MTSTVLGRRESKKLATREHLVESAVKLFTERGYQATTIADIAVHAGVAPRTFFAYFPTKEAVLFWPLDVIATDLEQALTTAPEDALSILRSWARRHATWITTDFRVHRELIEQASVDNQPVAIAGLVFIRRLATAVGMRLRADLGSAPDDVMPDMAAAAAVAAITAAFPMVPASGCEEPVRDRARRLLDDLDTAIRFARAGLEATRPPRT